MRAIPPVAAFLLLQLAPVAHAATSVEGNYVTAEDAKSLVGSARFVWAGSDKAFADGHIPGSGVAYSHDLHYLDDVRKCDGLPMCEANAGKYIGGLGIDASTPVVVYDEGVGVNASGTWFFLKLYGHPNVKMIEGGLAAWQAAGGAVEKGAAKAASAKSFSAKADRSMIANRAEVEKATKDAGSYLIVDARHKLDQYTGKQLQSALDRPGKETTVKRGGHIPNAVFSPWSKYAGNKKSKADKPTFKADKKLKKQLSKLEKHGYAPNKTVISYCHVGLGRGTFQYLALKKAGHDNVKLYVGSWNEWGNDDSLPLGEQL
jgi:thiosulfate/3-mercaptopyruvate sulfurtransferase